MERFPSLERLVHEKDLMQKYPFHCTCSFWLECCPGVHCSSLTRCVAEDQRTLALGVQSFFWRMFGSIPGPILFGVIFDSTCLFWQYDCGRRGNCWVYDNSALSVRAVVLAVLAMSGYIISVFLCWLVYPDPREDTAETDPKKEEHLMVASGDGETTKPVMVERVNEKSSGQKADTSGGPGDETSGDHESRAHSHTSVIGLMQSRNSTAGLLEMGSNSSSSQSTNNSTDL